MAQLQTFILAGGKGSRLHSDRPKALTMVNGRPIIEHQIGRLLAQGLNQVSIALGSQQDAFVQHFGVSVQDPQQSPIFQRVSFDGNDLYLRLLSTGANCDTGGRLSRLSNLIEQPFLLSWCDGYWDLNVHDMVDFHSHGNSLATILAVHPPARFGRLELQDDQVLQFREKPVSRDEWISGGLFVIDPPVLERINGDDCSFERQVLTGLALDGELQAWRHEGFWHCMDTPADHDRLEQLLVNRQVA